VSLAIWLQYRAAGYQDNKFNYVAVCNVTSQECVPPGQTLGPLPCKLALEVGEASHTAGGLLQPE
jgi:hypothetical protein